MKLASDVRKELERLARDTKSDPNDILRELLVIWREGWWKLVQGKPDVVILPQLFLNKPAGEPPPWGRIVMKATPPPKRRPAA
jgi:hypothetical protein